MDTDSAYLALAAESVDALVTPELREHYFRHRSEWLPSECCDDHRIEYVRCRFANRPWVGDEAYCKARKAYDKRTPGLFKVVWSGDGFVGLCSKTYYCFGPTDKYSTKGLSKRLNDIDKDAIYPPPEWQEAYATMDLVDVRFEEGLPSSSMFDSSTRNLIVIDDLMAETDERVTNLFTKNSHHRNTSVLYLVQNCSLKTKKVVQSV